MSTHPVGHFDCPYLCGRIYSRRGRNETAGTVRARRSSRLCVRETKARRREISADAYLFLYKRTSPGEEATAHTAGRVWSS